MKDSGPPGVSAMFRVVSPPLLPPWSFPPAGASDRPPPSEPPHAALTMSAAAATSVHAVFDGFIRSPLSGFGGMVGVGAHRSRVPVLAARQDGVSLSQRREQFAAEPGELGQ